MSNDFRLIEVLVMETDPHPLDVEKGDFTLWHTIATLAGIDLLEEEALHGWASKNSAQEQVILPGWNILTFASIFSPGPLSFCPVR